VLDRYRLGELIARGSFGEVHAATDLSSGNPVVVKVLRRGGEAARRRFAQEADILARLGGRSAPALVDAFEHSGARYLVIERLEGETLLERLRRERVLEPADIGWIVRDVLSGLCLAHAERVVHRDLKPSNVFLERHGNGQRARLLDFGVSKLDEDDDDFGSAPGLTSASATVGTAAYMAPEQYRGSAEVDGRADVYAVGAIAFELSCGRLAHAARSAELMLWQKLELDAPSLADVTGERWPAELEAFLRRALARDRERRFASAAEAQAAWTRLAEPGWEAPDRDRLRARLAAEDAPAHEATWTDD
jgi:serine/threonine-protein kinase